MRKTVNARQRGRKIIFFLLLLPTVALGLWGLLALAGPGETERRAGYSGDTLVESSSLRRNNIYDRNLDTLALSFRLGSLYARPLEINDPEATATELARLLALDRRELLDSFRSERSFVWLTRQVEKEVVEEVLSHGFPGIYAMPRSHRYYPQHHGAAHAIGFVKDEQGLAGIELSYDNILRGGIGDIRLAAAGVPEKVVMGGGVHLVSTLDWNLQRELEQRLARVMRVADGQSGAALVMDVESGALLAMVSLPTYDPNRFWAAGPEERLNRAVMPQVRPGVLREIFRLAAAGVAPEAMSAATATGQVEQAEQAGQAWWRSWEPGVYASASLASVLRRVETGPSEEFLEQIGLCRESDLDLLEGRSLAESINIETARRDDCRRLFIDHQVAGRGIALLAAFSRLVNQGLPVEPHLVKGFWDGEQFWPRRSEIGGVAAPPDISRDTHAQLLKTAGSKIGSGQGAATYESLVALEQPEPHVRAWTGGGAEVDEDKAPEPEQRYQAVLLSMAPAAKPTLAALVFLDQARLDPALPSPLAGVIRDLERWSAELRRSPELPSPDTVLAREDSLYRQWLEMREKGELPVHAAAGRAQERMPDVQGLSLRKALQVLQSSGLRLRVDGSGRVVSQQPRPGASLRGVDEGVIELRPGGELVAAGR